MAYRQNKPFITLCKQLKSADIDGLTAMMIEIMLNMNRIVIAMYILYITCPRHCTKQNCCTAAQINQKQKQMLESYFCILLNEFIRFTLLYILAPCIGLF